MRVARPNPNMITRRSKMLSSRSGLATSKPRCTSILRPLLSATTNPPVVGGQLPCLVFSSTANECSSRCLVFSDSAHQHLVYPNLTVVTVATDLLSSRSQPNWPTFLLEFFSVNLKKEAIASGHTRPNSVSGQGALEFIAFGVPQQKAVSNWSRRQ
jgi:hypothetical protein